MSLVFLWKSICRTFCFFCKEISQSDFSGDNSIRQGLGAVPTENNACNSKHWDFRRRPRFHVHLQTKTSFPTLLNQSSFFFPSLSQNGYLLSSSCNPADMWAVNPSYQISFLLTVFFFLIPTYILSFFRLLSYKPFRPPNTD